MATWWRRQSVALLSYLWIVGGVVGAGIGAAIGGPILGLLGLAGGAVLAYRLQAKLIDRIAVDKAE